VAFCVGFLHVVAVVGVDVETVTVAVADIISDDLMRLSMAKAPMAVVASPGVVLCRLKEMATIKL